MSVSQQSGMLHKWECFLGTLILVCCAFSLRAQSDAAQFLNKDSQGQQFISANQLLTPRKAQRDIDQARQDVLRGHLDSAQKEVNRALDLAPHCAVALALQAALRLQAGNLEEAAKGFQQAVTEDPTLGAAYVGSAVVLIAQDKFKEALIPLNRATSLLPGSWYVHLQAGLVHLGLGNTDTALQEADLAERFAGSDPERMSGASYLHALVYTAMKDSDRAKKCLAETISRDPGGFYATLATSGRLEQLQAAVDGRK